MECDLRRLNFAIDAVQNVEQHEWRERYRIAGWQLEDRPEDPDDNEAFNDQLRATVAMFRKGSS